MSIDKLFNEHEFNSIVRHCDYKEHPRCSQEAYSLTCQDNTALSTAKAGFLLLKSRGSKQLYF